MFNSDKDNCFKYRYLLVVKLIVKYLLSAFLSSKRYDKHSCPFYVGGSHPPPKPPPPPPDLEAYY